MYTMFPDDPASSAVSWLPPEEIEEQAVEQIRKISALPFIFRHVGIMPDCHLGKGATVGSVIPTKGAIIPAAVGVDIGCGMMAVKTQLKRSDLDPDSLSDLRENIERRIPLEAGARNRSLHFIAERRWDALMGQGPPSMMMEDESLYRTAQLQLGTLGSGNHFIEIVYDLNGDVWAFLHSGSRGVGNKVAMRHIKIAQQMCDEYGVELDDPDLAYLRDSDEEFWHYWHDMQWCQRYALENRRVMMDRVITALGDHIGLDIAQPFAIECHHNFSEIEYHFGTSVYVSRKGAINAEAGKLGLIPGSMGTPSYVVKGKGNVESFNTAPHGAGRRFSRNQAKKRFDMADFDKAMEGIEVKRTKEFLDEVPGAYKNINDVISHSADLVTPINEFRQIINVKGASGLRRRRRRQR